MTDHDPLLCYPQYQSRKLWHRHLQDNGGSNHELHKPNRHKWWFIVQVAITSNFCVHAHSVASACNRCLWQYGDELSAFSIHCAEFNGDDEFLSKSSTEDLILFEKIFCCFYPLVFVFNHHVWWLYFSMMFLIEY